MVARMNGSFDASSVTVGQRVTLKKESKCKYSGKSLYVKSVYSKNGNKCVDLNDGSGELLIMGIDIKFLGKAR